MIDTRLIAVAMNLSGFTKKEHDDILELVDLENISNSQISILKKKDFSKKLIEAENILKDSSYTVVTIYDEEYPAQLLDLSDAPLALYILGSLKKEDALSISIVGTRKPTNYGYTVTKKLTEFLSEYKITVVSGFARGVDIVAHITAVENGTRTLAVLGSGLRKIYPPEHKKYLERLIKNGAIISEFPPDFPAFKENFPKRNRIIAAFSLGSVVVEADVTSGAIITARYATELGREVFAVPGSIFEKNSKGTNRLIRDGARILDEFSVIMDSISNFKFVKKEVKKPPELTDSEKKIIDFLSEEKDFDELLKAGLNPEELTEKLLELELKGLIRRLAGGRFVRTI